MLPHQQLILGILASLVFWALLRFTPLLRDLLAAAAAIGLILLTITGQAFWGLDAPSLFGKLSGEILSYPHFFLGFSLATAVVLAVLYVSQWR
jgi:hypothetical protein